MKVKLSEYAKMQGVSVRTLWRCINEWELEVERSSTNRVYVNLEQSKNEYVVVYTRVSSSENKSNLDSQAERLVRFCEAKGWIVKDVVKEAGSGLNDERRKLTSLFADKRITKVVVEHKDRLTRFGFNYLQKLWGVEIVVVNEVAKGEEDLMQDFVSLVTSFCARLYGKRRSKRVTEKLIKALEE